MIKNFKWNCGQLRWSTLVFIHHYPAYGKFYSFSKVAAILFATFCQNLCNQNRILIYILKMDKKDKIIDFAIP